MAAIIPLLAGAALGSALSSKGGGGSVQAPAPRDYASEGRDTLQAQIDLAPQLFAAEQQFRPQYAQLDTNILKSIVPQVSALQEQATTSQRTADIRDVQNLGAAATEAFRNANPQLAKIQDALTARALQGGDSDIMNRLRTQAMTELNRGGSLSPQEQRLASQSARAAFNARGIARGDAGAFAEALNSDRYSNAREAQRRQFALGVDSADLQRQQYGSNLLGTTGQFLSSTSSDPFQAILGRSATPASVGTAGFSLQSQPQIFNPFDPYAGGIYASNQQNQMDAATASAANRASTTGSLIGAAGQIAGAYLMCWVARSAYGVRNPRWLVFRRWMTTKAPSWFRAAYIKHGPSFAEWLDALPVFKPFVRAAMNLTLKFA